MSEVPLYVQLKASHRVSTDAGLSSHDRNLLSISRLESAHMACVCETLDQLGQDEPASGDVGATVLDV